MGTVTVIKCNRAARKNIDVCMCNQVEHLLFPLTEREVGPLSHSGVPKLYPGVPHSEAGVTGTYPSGFFTPNLGEGQEGEAKAAWIAPYLGGIRCQRAM